MPLPLNEYPFGAVPADNGGVTYVVLNRSNIDAASYDIRTVDPDGTDHLVTSITGPGVGGYPTAFVKLGADHWVVVSGKSGTPSFPSTDPEVRFDVDNGTVTATDLVTPPGISATGYVFVDSADAAGNLYGVSANLTSGFAGNRVFRIAPDGTVAVIAGTGVPDPANARQSGMGSTLNLSATYAEATDNGNLLISSGHVVYTMVNAAQAPAVTAAGS
ncbi:MAG: hypothetical protein JST73_07915 [Actinobacteria bacterium]|nr:hypothetical protein [Actinomycetota bacterium]